MSAITLPALLQGIATQLRTVPGLKAVHYPLPSKIVNTPCLIVYSGSPETSLEISHEGPGEQMWTGQLFAQLLVARSSDVAIEVAKVDALAMPIVDALSIDRDGMGVEIPGFGGNLDRLLLTRMRMQQGLAYGGQSYAGVELFIDIKFHRVWDVE